MFYLRARWAPGPSRKRAARAAFRVGFGRFPARGSSRHKSSTQNRGGRRGWGPPGNARRPLRQRRGFAGWREGRGARKGGVLGRACSRLVAAKLPFWHPRAPLTRRVYELPRHGGRRISRAMYPLLQAVNGGGGAQKNSYTQRGGGARRGGREGRVPAKAGFWAARVRGPRCREERRGFG